jgi:hypothetical protein
MCTQDSTPAALHIILQLSPFSFPSYSRKGVLFAHILTIFARGVTKHVHYCRFWLGSHYTKDFKCGLCAYGRLDGQMNACWEEHRCRKTIMCCSQRASLMYTQTAHVPVATESCEHVARIWQKEPALNCSKPALNCSKPTLHCCSKSASNHTKQTLRNFLRTSRAHHKPVLSLSPLAPPWSQGQREP